jgi:hypothetical protein
MFLTEECRPSRPLQLAGVKFENIVNMCQKLSLFSCSVQYVKDCLCVCVCLTVTLRLPYIVLAVMCIYVIYKCLSWGGDQQQAKLKDSQAKPPVGSC